MRHVLEAANWVEASASHFVGTFIGLTLIALLAVVGAVCVARWMWRHVRADVLWAAGEVRRRVDRYRWNVSARRAALTPIVLVFPEPVVILVEHHPAGVVLRAGRPVDGDPLPQRVPASPDEWVEGDVDQAIRLIFRDADGGAP